MKKFLIVIGIVVFFLVGIAIIKNQIIKSVVTKVASGIIGAPVHMDSFSLNILSSTIHISGFKIYNPSGFPEGILVSCPKIKVIYDRATIFKQKRHFLLVEIELKEMGLTKNKEGKLNVDSLKIVQQPKSSEPIPMQIDLLTLSVGKIVYKDYTIGTEPSVRVYDVNKQKSYKGIPSAQQLALLVLAEPMKTRLDYFDVAEKLKSVVPVAKPVQGQAPQPAPNPEPAKEREIWTREVAKRPWSESARAYVPRLKPVFAGEQVPEELVWVAEVESSFDPRARSPSGARGLFQLMPSTAKRFGLSLFPRDQRVQPEQSARAAAQYLKYLHGYFKDWRLALAAYNAGEGTVQRLLKTHQAQTFDAIATHLPAETQMYVPKIEATLMLREGVRLGKL